MSATQAPPLQTTDFEDLAGAVRGEMLLPADADYDVARRIWNGAIDRRPGCIVRCTGVADVVAAVRFARGSAGCSSRSAQVATGSAGRRCATTGS